MKTKMIILALVAIVTLGLESCRTHTVYSATRTYEDANQYGEWHNCYSCAGKGSCTTCKGTGKIDNGKCRACKGTGRCAACDGKGGYRK